jgi:uncharacterized membrane protein YhaH (DUF805 family)
MGAANSNSTRRSWYYWLTLVPLVVGASLALLKFGAAGAFYGANLNRPSQAWQLKEAARQAELYWWVMMSLAVTATVVATILVRPPQTLSAGLRALVRVVGALVLIVGSIYLVAYGLSVAGYYLK